jgi:hypothetical protein
MVSDSFSQFSDLFFIICCEWFWQVWHTTSLYHLVHTTALLGAPITKRPNVVSTSAARFNIFAVAIPPG